MKYKLEKPVKGSITKKKYQCKIEWRNGEFISGEPPSIGGEDTGPDPYTLLLSLPIPTGNVIKLRKSIATKAQSVCAYLSAFPLRLWSPWRHNSLT